MAAKIAPRGINGGGISSGSNQQRQRRMASLAAAGGVRQQRSDARKQQQKQGSRGIITLSVIVKNLNVLAQSILRVASSSSKQAAAK